MCVWGDTDQLIYKLEETGQQVYRNGYNIECRLATRIVLGKGSTAEYRVIRAVAM